LWRRRSPAGQAGAHPCSTPYSVEQADEAALQCTRDRPRPGFLTVRAISFLGPGRTDDL
jgi:hypothetical protein